MLVVHGTVCVCTGEYTRVNSRSHSNVFPCPHGDYSSVSSEFCLLLPPLLSADRILQWPSVAWPHCKAGGTEGGDMVRDPSQLIEDHSLIRPPPLDAGAKECLLVPASSHAQGVHHQAGLWPVSQGGFRVWGSSLVHCNKMSLSEPHTERSGAWGVVLAYVCCTW